MVNKTWTKGEYTISTDKTKLQIDVIHSFLSNSYWAKDIPIEYVRKAIDNSVCFGVYHNGKQVGFARCITDLSTYGYLCDVFILPAYQKFGLGKWLVEVIFSNDELNLRRWGLATRDAHGLYEKVGFKRVSDPQKILMEKVKPNFFEELKKQNLEAKNRDKLDSSCEPFSITSSL